jgi:hypothetical protein
MFAFSGDLPYLPFSSSSSLTYQYPHCWGTGVPYGLYIRRTGHNSPPWPSAGWWLRIVNAARTIVLTCLPKHGGARDNKFLVTHDWPKLLNFRDHTPKHTARGAIELLILYIHKPFASSTEIKFLIRACRFRVLLTWPFFKTSSIWSRNVHLSLPLPTSFYHLPFYALSSPQKVSNREHCENIKDIRDLINNAKHRNHAITVKNLKQIPLSGFSRKKLLNYSNNDGRSRSSRIKRIVYEFPTCKRVITNIMGNFDVTS